MEQEFRQRSLPFVSTLCQIHPVHVFPIVFNGLIYFRSPTYNHTFRVVLLHFRFLTKTLYAFFQSPVRISRFAYLVVLDVVIRVSCTEHKSCSSSPWNSFQSPVTSSLVGPISFPAPHSQTPSSYVLPMILVTTLRTHTKQQAKLRFWKL
jgi:hypothetical protein